MAAAAFPINTASRRRSARTRVTRMSVDSAFTPDYTWLRPEATTSVAPDCVDRPIACRYAVVKVNSMPNVPSVAFHPAPIMPGPHEPFIMLAEPIMSPLTY